MYKKLGYDVIRQLENSLFFSSIFRQHDNEWIQNMLFFFSIKYMTHTCKTSLYTYSFVLFYNQLHWPRRGSAVIYNECVCHCTSVSCDNAMFTFPQGWLLAVKKVDFMFIMVNMFNIYECRFNSQRTFKPLTLWLSRETWRYPIKKTEEYISTTNNSRQPATVLSSKWERRVFLKSVLLL